MEVLDDAFGGRAIIGNPLGRTALMRGRTTEAIERFDASVVIARRIDDKLGLTLDRVEHGPGPDFAAGRRAGRDADLADVVELALA